MSFRIRQRDQANGLRLDPTIWLLEDGHGNELSVWPALGFNAFHWAADGHDLLYCDAAFFDELKPTRSGWPILFPFPNRIRDGRFSWQGKSYQLPLNDSSGKNAIHGFPVRRPWRVVAHDAHRLEASLTGEFHASRDAPDALGLWPADYRLQVTYRLAPSRLRVEATVENPDDKPLPFGLGYHPYFRTAPFGAGEALVSMFAGGQWELIETLPTGALLPLRPVSDVPFAELQLDHVYTAFEQRAAMTAPDGGSTLMMTTSADFRELVAFTPPHRQAICFEPYTCTTDAINLQQRGVDAGLRVLEPGGRWTGWVEVALVDGALAA